MLSEVLPLLSRLFKAWGRIGDLIRLDDPVMVRVERLEEWRQWPAMSPCTP